MKSIKLSDFIIKAKKVHLNKYTYDKFIYKKAIEKSTITCPIHGDFNQNAHNHINGKGCKKCAIDKQIIKQKQTKKTFIIKAHLKFNNIYDYSKVIYVNLNTKVEVVCKKHGSFYHSPIYHLQSTGCPKCIFEKRKGFYNIKIAERNKKIWQDKDAYVYLVKFTSNVEQFYKIGITVNSIKKRFESKLYDKAEICTIKTNLYKAIYLEKQLLNKFKQHKYIPMKKIKGYTECFNFKKEHLDFVKSIKL